jgi:hypothetical protein
MDLKLSGQFSYVDKLGKMHFVFLDEYKESKTKLTAHTEGNHLPYDEREFKVIFGTTFDKKNIPDDINNLVGHKVHVYVKIKPYKFVSQRGDNKGERITGCNLVFQSIEKVFVD